MRNFSESRQLSGLIEITQRRLSSIRVWFENHRPSRLCRTGEREVRLAIRRRANPVICYLRNFSFFVIAW